MLARDLGAFVANVDHDALPAPVVEAAKLRILDLLAAGLAGYRLGNQEPMMPFLSGHGQATVWGIGPGFACRDAALANSFLAHSTYLEDGSRYTGGHPSSVVIPGALALGEERKLSGRALIAAVVAGYEVFLRLGRAIYPSTVNRGFQSTAVLGAVASAAACAAALGVDGTSAKNAIAMACSLGTGLKEALKSSRSGPLQVARSCEGGVLAALLAAAGEEGADAAIENGFVRAYSDDVDLDGVLTGLGTEFRIFETYIKLHAGCRGNHAPIDVVLQTVRDNAILPETIRRISLRVDSVTHAGEVPDPRNAAQAQFNIAFSVAIALLDGGQASLFAYTDERLHDSRTRALMGTVEVAVDPGLDADYPDKRGAIAEIELNDGRRFNGAIDNARGEPESALGRSDIEAKFLAIAEPVLGPLAAEVRNVVLNLETVAYVGSLTACLRAPPQRTQAVHRLG